MASWRDVLPIHPAANLFPRMTTDELRALGKDIRKNELRSSVAVWTDGRSPLQLVDGISRLDAIELVIGPAIVGPPSISAGKDFLALDKVITLDRSINPWAYAISANVHRRHLTGEQKRDLIAKLLQATPEKSDRQIAETVKASPTTVGTVRAGMEAKGDVSKMDTRTDRRGRSQPARKTAPKTAPKTTPKTTVKGDDIGATSGGEIERKDAEIEELRNAKRMLEIKVAGLESEIGDAKAVRKPEGDGDGEKLGNLLRAWDRASPGVREKFKARAGLVAADGLDIPDYLDRRAAR